MHTTNKDGSVSFTNDKTACVLTMLPTEFNTGIIAPTNDEYRLVSIRPSPTSPTSISGFAGGLRDLLDEAIAYQPNLYDFSTYEWLEGTTLPCIRRLSNNAMIAAKWPDDHDSVEVWKEKMVAKWSTKYPGISL